VFADDYGRVRGRGQKPSGDAHSYVSSSAASWTPTKLNISKMPTKWNGVRALDWSETMTFDAPNLIAGAFFGVPVGFLAHLWFVRYKEREAREKLRRTYIALAGDYVNYRIKDDGAEMPTGGTIRLTQRSDGSFEVKGLRASGDLDWTSEIHMKMVPRNTGTGSYRYPAPDLTKFGVQQITFIPETRCIHVVGVNTSRGISTPFVHLWKRRE
jgi:hypothetical protein